jgi:hypothetical protein
VVTFERRYDFRKGYNKLAEGKGVHGMEIHFHLVGELGAVSFELSTGWVPDQKPTVNRTVSDLFPMGNLVGFHWKTQKFGFQTRSTNECPLTGGACWWDASFLAGDDLLRILIDQGEEPLWAELEARYAAYVDG